jgi:hypothetical protein
MKNAALILLACLLGVALSHPATAYSGKELYRSCAAKNATRAEVEGCTAYVRGFVDGMIMGYTAHGTVRGYCPPVTGVSVAKGRAIIEKFLREHPERLSTEARILAGLALSEAFPCQKK